MRKIFGIFIVFLLSINQVYADNLENKVLTCERKSPWGDSYTKTAIAFISSRKAKVIRYVDDIYEPMKIFKYRYKTDIDFIYLTTSTSAKLKRIKIDRKKLTLNGSIYDKCKLKPNLFDIEKDMQILFDTREYIKKKSNKI